MSSSPQMPAFAFRAQLLGFDPQGQPQHHPDGLLLVDDHGHVLAFGDHAPLSAQWAQALQHLKTQKSFHDLPGRLIAPGFVDIHVHYPQLDVIASPATGLLPWLENYTFPHEQRFHDPLYAQAVAEVFLDELLRHGVTTALAFCTSHPGSVDAFMHAAQTKNLRMVAGKVLQDRHSPEGLRDDTQQGLRDTETLIQRWHDQPGQRLGYAITPRFAPTSSPDQLAGAGELAKAYPSVWVQSHVAENLDEVAWVKSLFPEARSYLDVYEQVGLLRPRSVWAHCIHLDSSDRQLMAARGATAAVCPTSNLFLGSGLFDFDAADQAGLIWGLASDVGGGTSFSPLRTMLTAYEVARLQGRTLSPSSLWWHHTGGASKAMGLDQVVGRLAVGQEADFVVLNPHQQEALPLLARRVALSSSLEELLFAILVLGDDRVVEGVGIAGRYQTKH